MEACTAITLAFVIMTVLLWFGESSWLALVNPNTCPTAPGYDANFERVVPSSPPGLDLIDRHPFRSPYTTTSSRQRTSTVAANPRLRSL